MPANTNRHAAKRKTNPLPEMSPNPKVSVRKVGKGVGILEIPVHVSDGPQRLPDDESKYLHKARTVEAPLSKGQIQAIAAYQRGVGLPEIAKSSGLPSQTLIKTLKTVGFSEETHKKELEELETYYTNRNNP
jgi:hypothetical protein